MSKQVKLIQLFHHFLASGFNLQEIVHFLERSHLVTTQQVIIMKETLLSGDGFPILMKNLGFSEIVVTQLSLADIHGNYQESLEKIEYYLKQIKCVKKRLVEVTTYPLILLSFLFLITLGLKNYLLPQLEEGNIATKVLHYFPQMLFATGLSILVIFGITYYISKKMRQIKWFSTLGKLPIIGRFTQLYLTAYYAREWGNLLSQGLELFTITTVMKKQDSLLFQEIGTDMKKALIAGESFHSKVLDYPFFLKELSLMIEYGDAKSKLGKELELFSEELWDRFFNSVTRSIQYVQPFIFIIVALMIVMIYAAMLLPMYQSMEVM